MKTIMTLAKSFACDDDGATLIEYALLTVLIAMIVAISALTVGQAMSNQFDKVSTCLGTPSRTTCSPA